VYRREILRIGVRDILQLGDLKGTTEELSDLADHLINESCVLAREQLLEKYGPQPDTPFAVIGLGKLGGRELNYSSISTLSLSMARKEKGGDRTGNR